jgi:hypothetical protein
MAKAPIPRGLVPGYTFADVLVLTSASKSNLQHWLREDIIAGDFSEAGGKGVHRRFSTFNVIEIEMCAAMNRFHVPVSVIRGAANVFRSFHIGAVALHEELSNVPFDVSAVRVVTPGCDGSVMPGRVGLIAEQRWRESAAKAFVMDQARRVELPILRTQTDADRAREHASKISSAWATLRASSLIQGIADVALNHFYGLFVCETFADVLVDPTNLRHVIDGSAIVIDLADVVWRVGQRAKRLSCTLGKW